MKKLNSINKGFTLVETLLVVIVLALIGFGGLWVYSQRDSGNGDENQSTTTETPADTMNGNADEERQLTEEEEDAAYCAKITSEVPKAATIRFASDSTTALDEPAKEIALHFIDYLNCKSTYGNDPATATVYGHAAGVGTPNEELELSRRRAEIVAQYMIDQGVGEELVKIEAKGSTEPAGDNSTAEGRAQNRRVVVSID